MKYIYQIKSLLVLVLTIASALSPIMKVCDDIECSEFMDYVCGSTLSRDGTESIVKYYNICYMRKKQCELGGFAVINEIPHHYCNIVSDLPTDPEYRRSVPRRDMENPRVKDFSIVGAHQVCNHTCPIYCTDSYDPVCAQIWNRGSDTVFSRRAMVNHCHVDLLSCSTGLNVTISPLYQCYKNPSGLMFMKNMAALKSMKLMEENRRSNSGVLKSKLLSVWEFIRRTFKDIGTRVNVISNEEVGNEFRDTKGKANDTGTTEPNLLLPVTAAPITYNGPTSSSPNKIISHQNTTTKNYTSSSPLSLVLRIG